MNMDDKEAKLQMVLTIEARKKELACMVKNLLGVSEFDELLVLEQKTAELTAQLEDIAEAASVFHDDMMEYQEFMDKLVQKYPVSNAIVLTREEW